MKLRAFQESDWPRAAALLTSSEVGKTYMLPEFESKEQARPLFERLMALSVDGARYVRAMEAGGLFVGFCNDVERDGDTVEIGYAICPDVWGRGYATAALKLAIEELFALGYRQVAAGAFEENKASLRCMEKAGMIPMDKTDVIEYRGRTHSCVYRAIKNKEDHI